MMAMMTRKLGMMSLVNDQGAFSALTLLQASPNTVTQIKTPKTDGYSALQLGFGTKKKLPKPQSGHFSRAKVSPQVCREFRCQEIPTDLTVGDQITTNNFAVGDTIKVTATSKGKGFAGTIKRHNFHRQSKTHGGKGNIRKLGSIGSMYPQKVYKGRKMPGRLGGQQVTTRNLKIMLVDHERQVIGVAGAIPGPKRGLVMIKRTKP